MAHSTPPGRAQGRSPSDSRRSFAGSHFRGHPRQPRRLRVAAARHPGRRQHVGSVPDRRDDFVWANLRSRGRRTMSRGRARRDPFEPARVHDRGCHRQQRQSARTAAHGGAESGDRLSLAPGQVGMVRPGEAGRGVRNVIQATQGRGLYRTAIVTSGRALILLTHTYFSRRSLTSFCILCKALLANRT